MSSLDNALKILDCYSPDRLALGVTEVAAELGLPKSSVSRLMKAMAGSGLLEPSQERRGYSPGPLAFRLGNLYLKHDKLLELVDKAVGRLVDEFGLTGYVGMLEGAEVVLVSVRQGSYPVRLVLPKGTRLPAHVTAVGLALLARFSDARVSSLYPTEVLYGETGQVSSASEIKALVAKTRDDGFAFLDGITYRGFNAVAAAVASEDDGHLFAFSLSCPQEIATPELQARVRRRILQEAGEIGASVGDSYWFDTARDRAATTRRDNQLVDRNAADELLPS